MKHEQIIPTYYWKNEISTIYFFFLYFLLKFCSIKSYVCICSSDSPNIVSSHQVWSNPFLFKSLASTRIKSPSLYLPTRLHRQWIWTNWLHPNQQHLSDKQPLCQWAVCGECVHAHVYYSGVKIRKRILSVNNTSVESYMTPCSFTPPVIPKPPISIETVCSQTLKNKPKISKKQIK